MEIIAIVEESIVGERRNFVTNIDGTTTELLPSGKIRLIIDLEEAGVRYQHTIRLHDFYGDGYDYEVVAPHGWGELSGHRTTDKTINVKRKGQCALQCALHFTVSDGEVQCVCED